MVQKAEMCGFLRNGIEFVFRIYLKKISFASKFKRKFKTCRSAGMGVRLVATIVIERRTIVVLISRSLDVMHLLKLIQ